MPCSASARPTDAIPHKGTSIQQAVPVHLQQQQQQRVSGQQQQQQIQHMFGQQQQQQQHRYEQQPETRMQDSMGQAAAAPQSLLHAGLVLQALQQQSQKTAQAGWQQQQDRYILDHRIHREAVAESQGLQQMPAIAVGACGPTSAAPITVPGSADLSNGHCSDSLFSPSRSESVPGAVSSSPALSCTAPPNARKGMVLLDVQTHTRTVWEFEAVIVLLNGHWPPRGLLSGRWPPKPDTPETVLSTSMSDCPLGEELALHAVHGSAMTKEVQKSTLQHYCGTTVSTNCALVSAA